MGYQTPKLEKLFDKWAEKHAKKLSTGEPYGINHEPPYGKFVRDGIVNPDKWTKQEPKICFLMPEAGGYADVEKYPDGVDLAAMWNEKGSFTRLMFKFAVWIQAVYDAMFDPIPYVKKPILKQKDDLIRAVSIVNVKKSDGQLIPNYDLLQKFAHEDATEIRKEIELINPDIILCCNTFKFVTGQRPEDEEGKVRRKRDFVFYKDELKNGAKDVYRWEDKMILDFFHPAQFKYPLMKNTVQYYLVREFCRAGIATLGPFDWAEL